MNSDREAFLASVDVSRETMQRLDIYADLLMRWTKRINLIAPSTLATLWSRHFLDSAQIQPFVTSGLWVDAGSGGGFPGAVLAILNPQNSVVLVESDQRKATFLRTVARETGTRFQVKASRIEMLDPLKAERFSCRALAPLTEVLGYADRHLCAGGRAILLKGVSAQSEIEQALEQWRFDCETYPSKTDPDAVILNIGDIKRA